MDALISDRLNAEVNWQEGGPCLECKNVSGWAFSAGSYASELAHFEESLGGALDEPRSRLRLLILFQDARKTDKFELASPFQPVKSLDQGTHRYFCLTQTAWENLQLDKTTGSSAPKWPTEEERPAYLERYLKRTRNSWSYDGFIAYLLDLFRPQDAYITNVAKCFADNSRQVFKNCAKKHLRQEILSFSPTAVISFTGWVSNLKSLEKLTATDLREISCFMRPYHPAARGAHRKATRLIEEIRKNDSILADMGCNVSELVDHIEADVRSNLG